MVTHSDFFSHKQPTKSEINLPWLPCLFCSYKDQIEWDLAQHMFEKHRLELLALPISSKQRRATKALRGDFYARFEPAMEFRLDKAVEMIRRGFFKDA